MWREVLFVSYTCCSCHSHSCEVKVIASNRYQLCLEKNVCNNVQQLQLLPGMRKRSNGVSKSHNSSMEPILWRKYILSPPREVFIKLPSKAFKEAE